MALHFLGIAAPGYYNHDETQWFIRSQELGESIRHAWIDQWSSLQWRPLSRTVWLLLARGQYLPEEFLEGDGVVLSFRADGSIVERRRCP